MLKPFENVRFAYAGGLVEITEDLRLRRECESIGCNGAQLCMELGLDVVGLVKLDALQSRILFRVY